MVQQRYAVVHFFERIDTKHIITDDNCDRSDMNGEDWDADQEVQVPWPLAKGKHQMRYVARGVVGEDARDQLRDKLDSAGQTENQALRTALKIINGLPDLLKKMEDLAGDNGKQNSGKNRPAPQIPRPVLPARPLRIPLAPETPATPIGSL